jgi:hypothetical protein
VAWFGAADGSWASTDHEGGVGLNIVASFLVADHDLDARSILATIAKNRIRPKLTGAGTFDQITRPTSLQRSAFDLLGAKL